MRTWKLQEMTFSLPPLPMKQSSTQYEEDRPVRIAVGQALTLIFEIGFVDKFSAECKSASDITQEKSKQQASYIHFQGLKGKVINQVKNLYVEAGRKSSAKISRIIRLLCL
ncbi:unnamed protein product [Lupinus luteus]|uniref:Interferon-related developmental regulator N-terminal domain-containing protein n=1 Tax=Lupinus luteus TaxID=3873 RepID=A0AAV1YAK7_LUPLU